MTRNMKAVLNITVLVSTLLLTSTISAAVTTANVQGQNTPPNSMDGRLTQLSQHVGKGKWTVVVAWHSKCGACKKSMPKLVAAKGSFPNAKLIGVSLDGKWSRAQKIMNQFNINFPTLLTSIKEFDQYVRKTAKKPLVGAPTYLIFAPNGKLRAMQSGVISPAEIKKYIREH